MLVDTNIFLEVLLDQERAQEVVDFLQGWDLSALFMSDFTYHSIGILTSRRASVNVFLQFNASIVIRGGVNLLSVPPSRMEDLKAVMHEHGLTFDDAYQFVVSDLHGLELLSFDDDFDETGIQRFEPADLLG